MSVTISADQGALAKRHSKGELAELVFALEASSTEICVDCGRTLGGLLGSFTWGLVNGAGECSNCGFLYVYYHRQELEPAMPDGTLILQAWVPNAEIPLEGARP